MPDVTLSQSAWLIRRTRFYHILFWTISQLLQDSLVYSRPVSSGQWRALCFNLYSKWKKRGWFAYFSGALSTISSGLNSLAAVLWEDILKDIPYFEGMSENRQGLMIKIIGKMFHFIYIIILTGIQRNWFIGFSYGILTIGMAFIAGSFSGILAAALVIFGGASGPILGTFTMGMFMPFVNKYVT